MKSFSKCKVKFRGNRTTYAYDAANQLSTEQTGTAVTTFSYDGNGNRTGVNLLGALTTYTWDGENRLTNIARPNASLSTYTYSSDGLRRKREETGLSLAEVWDGTQLLQEKDANTGAEVTRYLLQNSAYSGLRMQRKASDNIWRMLAYDVQGSNRALLNPDGTLDGTFNYRAFGEFVAQSGVDSLMRFGGFWGYQWDENSRMWVKARHLDGKAGRWMSQDPIGFVADWNLWLYVANGPMVWVDPNGEVPTGINPGTSAGATWPPVFVASYGNYCGGGRSPEATAIAQGIRPPTPIDDMDECCQLHDRCWRNNGCSGFSGFVGLSANCARCNLALVTCAQGVDCTKDKRRHQCPPFQKTTRSINLCWALRRGVLALPNWRRNPTRPTPATPNRPNSTTRPSNGAPTQDDFPNGIYPPLPDPTNFSGFDYWNR